MIKAIKEFIAERGLTLMLCGMLTVVIGVGAYMFFNTPRYAGTPLPQAAFALAVVGFVIYAIGRVSLAKQRSRRQRSQTAASDQTDEASAQADKASAQADKSDETEDA
jgi:flagellar biosynthesis/type III secretory pathway M-ring protein FliF/YscJ